MTAPPHPPYTGRFAPSPTGLLHAGSLVAALASWLDARAHGGRWLVRMEDVDLPRCVPGADHAILAQLQRCGLVSDAPVLWQSQRSPFYTQALEHLVRQGLAYPCACSRKDIAQALAQQGLERPRHGELVYPGTCRSGLHGRSARAWRLHVGRCLSACARPEATPAATQNEAQKTASAHVDINSIAIISIAHKSPALAWNDRRLGHQAQDVEHEVGDFVLRRADGLWAYQLAVVVDDAAQGVTHVVRGEDLADNTARQILLQRALGLPTPSYLHTPLVLGANGEKLSKQNGAQPLDLGDPAAALRQAAAALGLPPHADASTADTLLQRWAQDWARRGWG
ncbi:MAG: tRNA glutamyl-Q(34) synthetase GluQRS [Rhodoferax sp.]